MLIIADDLTGANDTGLQFAKAGIPTVVWMGGNLQHNPLNESLEEQHDAAYVLNTETRGMTAPSAYEAVVKLRNEMEWDRYDMIYKKVDSTLRGNIGTEIRALMEGGMFDFAAIVPAYPANGRVTVGGYHLLHGNLLEDTEIARDPKSPVQGSYVPELVSSRSGLATGLVDIREIRGGETIRRVNELLAERTRQIVFDIASDQDLSILTKQLMSLQVKILWVGSAGLAGAICAETRSARTNTFQSAAVRTSFSRGPVLVIAGSMSAVTSNQVRTLSTQGTRLITVDPLKLSDSISANDYVREAADKASELLRSGEDVVITTEHPSGDHGGNSEQPLPVKVQRAGAAELIASQLGSIGARLASAHPLSGIVLTGGDTAYQTCKQLGIRALKIIDQVEEGMPVCEVYGAAEAAADIKIVTKAGAFGNDSSLARAMEKLKADGVKYNASGK
jgi:uncharacterized protein YgbK (DUF1537 family)